ncbi:M20/M25/M40 family metallo-hydrolase [Demequina lignilytica]|uniref:M20/M25/M40 family metallo-hydrolase n=1 Tax=Demequina lignilytica TaxID=3051663 RepID=A0AB35MJE5_9MICO|nr:M20/M25/M40 family metallo-hydrolase [Demequina sp. SYSU T0a273]MDN4483847.1 M20/M25/M40 family metallo-hydrolase [Demequina sp. SYSU T0a273]
MIPAAPEVASRLAALVRVPTVTPPHGPLDDATAATFATFRAALRGFYPRVFAHEVETVGRAGLLIRIPGGDAAPVILMAHQDVVPVPEDWAAEGWEHGPFEGVISEGWVHGRGTLDDKGALAVALEAVDSLLGEGWTPPGDLYLSLGADEESHGDSAIQAATLLEARGVAPALILDEGGAVTLGAFPGLEGEAAVIGASEKGIVDVTLTVEGRGGHASTPPRESAPGILARALGRIEAHPHPSALHPVNVELLETVGSRLGGARGAVMRRAGALRWLLARLLPRLGAELAAMTRTTVAITQLRGSPAHNVLATSATATLNIRVAVGSGVDEAVAHVRRVIGDPRVRIDVEDPSEPSPVSPRGDSPAWTALTGAVAASYPEALVVPYVMLAASDSRHVAHLGPTYRFAPLRMSSDQRAAVHGPNEKVEVESLGRGVAFYRALLGSDEAWIRG